MLPEGLVYYLAGYTELGRSWCIGSVSLWHLERCNSPKGGSLGYGSENTAKLSASGKFIGQGKIVLGWSKGRATEYEVFQPEIKEGRVFFLCDRALSFHVALEVSTPARAICFGRELEGDFWQLKSRRAG
jgi:hypothetical protein